MNSAPIGFLDSGIGGVPYLLATMAAVPRERFVYYADNAHFPYGERTVDELRQLVTRAVAQLIEIASPRVIVVACNTASVVALATLRARFDVPFVGVVPAIKPAAELAGEGRIGVLATTRTVEDTYVAGLIRTFAPRNEVLLVPAGGLVELIERRLGSFEESELLDALDAPVRRLREARVGAVVLGCTHFIHVRPTVERLLDREARVIDSVDGVVRQTLRVAGCTPDTAGAGDLAATRTGPDDGAGAATVYLSDPDSAPESYRFLARANSLELRSVHARNGARR